MAYGYLASTLLMGVVLVLIAGATLGRRQRGVPSPAWGGDASDVEWYFAAVEDVTSSPTAWLVGFLGLGLGAAATAILYVSRPELRNTVGLAMILGSAAIFEVFLFYGTYRAARSRGITSALSATAGAWTAGVAAVGMVLVKLFLA